MQFGAMTNTQKAIVVGTLTAAVLVGVYEARRASRLLGQVERLQQQQATLLEQVQPLQQEGDEAKRRLAAVRDEKERPDPNTAELLRLRGAVGVLSQQLAEAKTQALAPMAQASEPADLLEQQKRTARIKGIDGKNYSMHLLSFAWDNQGWLPTNWQQLASFTNNYPVTETNEFELVHKRPVNLAELGTNVEKTILVRELLAWPTVDGQWGKIYGFADGHSLVVRIPDGNFAAWEEQNTFSP